MKKETMDAMMNNLMFIVIGAMLSLTIQWSRYQITGTC